MFKVDDQTYQAILEVVLKCATNCYFKGLEGIAPAAAAIEEEYQECVMQIYKLLGGEIKQ